MMGWIFPMRIDWHSLHLRLGMEDVYMTEDNAWHVSA